MPATEPVVLLPSVSATPQQVAALAAALGPVAAGAPILTPDIRPARNRPVVIEAAALTVLAAISAAGAERAVLVGHGWGALVALQVAAGHPARVPAMVLAPNATLSGIAAGSAFGGVLGLLPALSWQRLGLPPAQVLSLLDQLRPVDARALAARVTVFTTRTLVAAGALDLANRGPAATLARILPNGVPRVLPETSEGWFNTRPDLVAGLLGELGRDAPG